MTPVVILPNISRSEWQNRGFNGPAAPRVITEDELGPVTLWEQLESLPNLDTLSQTAYETARDVLSCGQTISGSHGQPSENPQTRSEYYEAVIKGIRGFDEKQQRIGLRFRLALSRSVVSQVRARQF